MRRGNIVAIVVISILSGVFFLNQKTEPSKINETLRVAFPADVSARHYEPTRIYLAPEYIFLETIYSPLVELNESGSEVHGGVAESYEWRGDELYLKIRENLKTIDGQPITAKDAEFSLKRVLVLTGNTHGNFKDLVCDNKEIKSIEDSCPGIRSEGNTLILQTRKGRSFLLFMLTSLDFAIIPKAAIDAKTLEIIDYRNTSGPYFVEKDSEDGRIILKANPHHYHFSTKIAQNIEFVPSVVAGENQSLKMFESGQVDFLTTVDKALPEEVIRLSDRLANRNIFSTSKIRTFTLAFTERGLKELSLEDRLSIGKKIREKVNATYASTPGYVKAEQFFPEFGDLALSTDQIKKVENLYQTVTSVEKIEKPLLMWLVRVGEEAPYYTMLKSSFPGLTIKVGKNSPSFAKVSDPNDMPHMYIAGPDTGFNEDISLISYTLNGGYLAVPKDQREEWLKNYMHIPDKDSRLSELKKAHLKSLLNANVVPLMMASYVALAKEPWKIDLSVFYANNPLWKVRHE